MRQLAVAAVTAAAVAGQVAPARADGTAVLGYRSAAAPVGADDAATAVGRAIDASGGIAVADPFARARDRLASGAVPAGWLRDFRRARELLDEGWRAYLAVNRTFAASRLGEARRIAERVVALPGGPMLFAEISLRLGAVVLDLGDADRARALFHLAATLDPARDVGLAEFPPDVVSAYAAAAAPPDGALRVAVEIRGGGGTVAIDGGAAESSPRAVLLAPGQHVAVARKPGFRPVGRLFEVDPDDATAQVVIDLEPEPRAEAVHRGARGLAVGRSERDAAIAVDGITLYGELDAVVLVAAVWRRGAPALLGQLCAGLPSRCGAVVEVGFAEPGQVAAAARELWRRLRAAGTERGFPPTLLVDRRIVAGEDAPSGQIVDDGDERDRWWQNPYLWLGVGAVAIGTGAAVILTRDRTLEPVVVGDPCSFVTCP
jgi:hypothetical protein